MNCSHGLYFWFWKHRDGLFNESEKHNDVENWFSPPGILLAWGNVGLQRLAWFSLHVHFFFLFPLPFSEFLFCCLLWVMCAVRRAETETERERERAVGMCGFSAFPSFRSHSFPLSGSPKSLTVSPFVSFESLLAIFYAIRPYYVRGFHRCCHRSESEPESYCELHLLAGGFVWTR